MNDLRMEAARRFGYAVGMGLLSSWFRAERRALDESSGWALVTQALRSGGASGPVTPVTALQIAAVFSCARVLAESFGQLPLELMERDGRKRTPATGHPLYWMLHLLPNPEMTSAELRMTMMGHLATWGNAYAQVVFDRAGRRRELWPLRPDRTTPVRRDDGALCYRHTDDKGQPTTLEYWEVLHVRGLSFDGITGYSPVGVARRAFELKLQMEEFATAFWANDARPGVVLKHPKVLGPVGQENLRRSWEDRHQGPKRTNRPAILEEGMDISVIGMPQSDAQFLESQKFSRTEIAALFRVPPHMIGDLERATFSNIEEQAQEFVDYTLMPWVELWKQAIARDLMSATEQRRYYAHFRTQALLRGKHIDRAQFYTAMQQIGAMSPNDVRELEDMNPIEGGDVYLVPLNMTPVQDAGKEEEEPQSAPKPGRDVGDEGGTANPDRDEDDQAQRALLEQAGLAADVTNAWVDDARVRLAARIGNDVRQAGAKALRQGGRLALSEWGESMQGEWRQAGEAMLARLQAVRPAATPDVWAWVTAAYQAAVRELIADGQ